MPRNEVDEEKKAIAAEKKKSKAAEAKEKAKFEKEKKELKAKQKKKAFADYADRLKAVEEVKTMTDTPGWQKFYANMQAHIKRHAEQVLDAEKSREVVQHQEGVKILRGQIEQIRAPVESLNAFVNAMPLFAPAEVARANFNEALGTVELTR